MSCGSPPPTAMADQPPVQSGDWQVATGFAASLPAQQSRNFYAVYAGEAFGNAERGVVAAIARGHPESPDLAAGGRDAAQLVAHSLAEGYFGAPQTLSSRRAANVALTAVNRWLFAQARQDVARHMAPVSLTALMFHNSQIGIVQIGAGQIYRYRNKILAPVMRDHTRVLADGRKAPTRAIGLDLELSVDYAEEEAAVADRYILVTGVDDQKPDILYTKLAARLDKASDDPGDFARDLLAALAQDAGDDKTMMVLDIIAAPKPEGTALVTDLASLPLRAAPREGDVWDGFVLGKTLHRGRYTMLKAAYDSVGKREVALKIPLPTMLQDEVFAAGFMREAWIGAKVRGAGVARYLDLPPERRSSLYLVMPLYKGETLEARLRHPPAMSLPEGIGIAIKLCNAVQDLAELEIIHRDIKPDNIMLLAHNEIRLLDLGLAYLPGIDSAQAAKPGGTIRYMAPELLRGAAASARTEVYALGVTIYRMFCLGAFPYGQRESVPLARLRPDLPRWLGEALARSMDPDPRQRFADAGAFAAALQSGLVSGPEAEAKSRVRLPVTRLQIWQGLTFLFAALALGLFLHGLK